ncbi:MAG TPA: hypothetical protein VJV22_15680 [Acidobacteriaceae bacterium]|nr:hypothetical protein [Acidobacteriaceae bacterium]
MTQPPFPAVFQRFAELLAERFATGIYSTEDAVRYTFFLALLEAGGYEHTDISLEEPLVGCKGREVETMVHANGGRPAAALEFKYDRVKLASQNRPQRAGAILRDIGRLAQVHAQESRDVFLVYLTDRGMDSYLTNPRHRLEDVFDQAVGGQCSLTLDYYHKDRPDSLSKAVQHFGAPCTVSCILRRQLPGDHVLRVFAIEHVPDPLFRYD